MVIDILGLNLPSSRKDKILSLRKDQRIGP